MSFLLDKIRDWRLKRKIPENMKNKHRWRYAGDGTTKIHIIDQDEVDKYNYARKRQKEKEDNERL